VQPTPSRFSPLEVRASFAYGEASIRLLVPAADASESCGLPDPGAPIFADGCAYWWVEQAECDPEAPCRGCGHFELSTLIAMLELPDEFALLLVAEHLTELSRVRIHADAYDDAYDHGRLGEICTACLVSGIDHRAELDFRLDELSRDLTDAVFRCGGRLRVIPGSEDA
jgi:hypothetical protein